MRGAARGLIVAAAVAAACGALAPRPAGAQGPDFVRAARDLDGAQFLEDEPVWLCDAGAPAPSGFFAPRVGGLELAGRDERGRPISIRPLGPGGPGSGGRAGELSRSFRLVPRGELHALDVGTTDGAGLRAGTYEVRSGERLLARFRVIAPRASELAVRAALARAARLSEEADPTRHADAARLYEAVLARYPRTSYRAAIYAGLWRLREESGAYAGRPGAWLEEVFAHYNSACFGVWALDRFVADVPREEARPILRRLVGLYPDTMLSRAARRFL